MLSRFTLSLLVFAFLGGCASITPQAAPAGPPPAIQGAGTLADPLLLPQAGQPIVMDGSLASWKAIAFLPAPVMKKKESCVKLAWRPEGLYGIAAVKDTSLSVDEENPWAGDAMEVWVDRDLSRPNLMGRTAIQFAMCPVPTKPGTVATRVVGGGEPDLTKTAFKTTWQKTADGYTLEFFIPAELMKPAVMAPGGQFGLNVVISDGGQPLESLFADKAVNQGYRNPSTWAVLKLVK